MRSKLDTVQPAIDAAVLQLDADLSLGALARVAGVSRFQFHRTFSAVVGGTPKRFGMSPREYRARALETGFIVATPVPGDGDVEAITLPAGQAA